MEVARWDRTKKQRYSLVGEVCPKCEIKNFPARQVCPNCGGVKILHAESSHGQIYSLTLPQTQTQPTGH
jgi:hypothetical protein